MGLTKKAERTRAKLLESAKRLIGERGFDKVSVEDITRDSGVAKGTFYHYLLFQVQGRCGGGAVLPVLSGDYGKIHPF